MTKKITALLLAFCLLICLSACNKEATSSDISSDVSQTETTDSQTEESSKTDTTDTRTDKSSSNTETPSNSTPTTSDKDNTTSSKPSNTTSKPTETSTPSSTPSTSSKPSEPVKELTKISFTTEIITTGMKNLNGIDCAMIYLYLTEKDDGTFYANYEITGWKSINVNNATATEQDALLKSVAKYQDFYYDFEAQAGNYWGWTGYNYGDSYRTYDDLKKAINLNDWNKNKDTEYFPSELFGNRLAISAQNVKCTYNKETGKLVLDSAFPFENISIKNNQSITINGSEYKKQDITGYNMH